MNLSEYLRRHTMRLPDRSTPKLLIYLCVFVLGTWSTVQAGSGCDDQLAVCGPSCVATERILNLYGLYGSASVLFLLPKTNSLYSLCYSRTTNTQPAISEIFCLTGRMDELQAVQPRYVTTIRGRCVNLQGFVADDSQYVIVFRESKEPMLHEVLLGQDRAVTFSFIHMVGSDGSTYAKVTYTGSQGAVVATTGSRQYCHSGDGTCAHSHVYILSVDTLTQCTALQSIPGEHVAGWSDDGVAYYVFASDVPNTPDMFTLQLFRVSVLPTGDCLLEMMQEVSFGQPLCGVRSLEIIRAFDARKFLLVASQRCASGSYSSSEGNILIKEWNPQAKSLVDSQSGRELPQTSSVVKITSVSPHFFVCQRHSEPSTVNVPTLPLSAPVVSTIRIHNQAPVNAVQAPNKDVFVTHVTSVGSVVVDWISCSLNQNKLPSNFSLTSYTGKRQDYSPSGITSYEDATRMVGKPVYVPDPPANPPGFLYRQPVMLPQHHFRQSVLPPPPPPPRLSPPSPPPSPPAVAPPPSLQATEPVKSPTPSELAKIAASAAAVPVNTNRLSADNQTMYDHPEELHVWSQVPSVRMEVPPQLPQWSPPAVTAQEYAGPRPDPYQSSGPFYPPPPPPIMSFPPNPYGPPGLPYGVPQYPGMYPPGLDYGNQVVNSPPNPYFQNAPNNFGYPPRPYDNTLPPPIGYSPRLPVNGPQMTSYDARPEVIYQPTKLRHIIIPQPPPSAYSIPQPPVSYPAVNVVGYPVVPEQNTTTEESTTTSSPTTEMLTTNSTDEQPGTTSIEPVVLRLALKLAELISTTTPTVTEEVTNADTTPSSPNETTTSGATTDTSTTDGTTAAPAVTDQSSQSTEVGSLKSQDAEQGDGHEHGVDHENELERADTTPAVEVTTETPTTVQSQLGETTTEGASTSSILLETTETGTTEKRDPTDTTIEPLATSESSESTQGSTEASTMLETVTTESTTITTVPTQEATTEYPVTMESTSTTENISTTDNTSTTSTAVEPPTAKAPTNDIDDYDFDEVLRVRTPSTEKPTTLSENETASAEATTIPSLL